MFITRSTQLTSFVVLRQSWWVIYQDRVARRTPLNKKTMSHCIKVMTNCTKEMTHCTKVMTHCTKEMTHCTKVMTHCTESVTLLINGCLVHVTVLLEDPVTWWVVVKESQGNDCTINN